MKLLQHEPSTVCGKSSVKKGLRAYAAAAPFVLPGLLLVLAFVIYPMFFTIRIALSEYRIVQGEITFIGLENFKNVLSGGSRFWYAYRNNFLYALVTVPFILLGGMLFAYLIGVGINVSQEMQGNPRIDAMGIAQDGGAMEGKEVRLGSAAGALWSVATTVTSNGSVNSMHDSTMPLSGLIEMLNMQINTWFGGVGVGWMNYFTFIIIAVFISGLMVGRTPEFLGHKVEAREMKIASIVALLHPFIILVGTASAAYLFAHAPEFVANEGGWLNNPGYHGLSEMLYEYTSSAANNGSGFEGLGDNTWFWNYSCGIVLILGRFVPIVGQVAIAGILAKKKYIPESAGTLKTDTVTFGVMTFAVIFIVAALSFFPVHALSTIAEFLSL